MQLKHFFILFTIIIFSSCQPLNNINTYSSTFKVWDNNNKLKWSDFENTCSSNQIDATAHTYINYGQTDSTYPNKDSVLVFIYAVFNKKYSCTTTNPLQNTNKYTTALLNHEQYHFNITELFARQLRAEIYNNKIINTKSTQFLDIYNNTTKVLYATQKKYDEETNHSQSRYSQDVWEKTIDSLLQEFKTFELPYVKLHIQPQN